MSDEITNDIRDDHDAWRASALAWCQSVLPACPIPRDEQIVMYELLSAPLAGDMVQVTPSSAGPARGGRTGYSYAGVVDRLNRVLGPGGWMIATRIRQRAKVGSWHYALIDLLLWIPCLLRVAEGVGMGRGSDTADAEKGAITTAIKRAAALVGPGWQAYAGTVDQDIDYQPPVNRQKDE